MQQSMDRDRSQLRDRYLSIQSSCHTRNWRTLWRGVRASTAAIPNVSAAWPRSRRGFQCENAFRKKANLCCGTTQTTRCGLRLSVVAMDNRWTGAAIWSKPYQSVRFGWSFRIDRDVARGQRRKAKSSAVWALVLCTSYVGDAGGETGRTDHAAWTSGSSRRAPPRWRSV
jgi:hypothetical protein